MDTTEKPVVPGEKLRQSGIEPVGAVPWGTHFCQFYEAAEDLVETLVPYFRAGLEANELCVWVTSAPLQVEEATAALRVALPELDFYLESGKIEILDSGRWYTRSGRFEVGPALQGWVDKLAEARERGFEGLRLTGNTLWLEQDSWDDFTRYEEAVNQVIGQHRMVALCTYSLERCGVKDILDVVSNHQFALVKRGGRWEVVELATHGKTEQALRESEQRYRALFEGMTEGFALHEILLDDQGMPCDYRFLEVNPAFERHTGLARETVLGRTVREILPGIEPRWVETCGRVALTGEPARFEDHAAPLGRDYEVHAYSPRRGQFAVLFTDVTERRRFEEELAWLASFPGQDPSPVVEVDLAAGAVSYANPAAKVQLPALVESGLRHPWLVGVEAIAEQLRATGAVSTFREVESDGSWFRQSFALAHPDRLVRVYGVDITDRMRAEQDREAARVEAVNERNRLEAVMEALPVGVAVVDAAGGTTRSNRAYEEIWRGPRPLPRSVEDYSAYKAWWVDSGRPVEPGEWASARALQRGEAVVGQLLQIERFDGTPALVHNSAAPFLDAHGRLAGAAVAILDVTDLREKEMELARLNERLVRAQRSAGAGMWEWDLETGRLEWSPELFRLFGLDPALAEADLDAWRGVLHPDDRLPAEERVNQALRDRTPLENEYRVLLPGGEVRWVNALGDTTCDEHGTPRRMAGICIDVTVRKQAEERIRAAVREKEVLLQEIHHRVKNNLQVIASMLNLQLAGITDEAVRGPLLESQNRVRALALIHEKLYGAKDFSAIPLNSYLAELASIVHRSFADAAGPVRLELDLEEVELEVGVAIPVALVTNELLSNALKHAFLPGRGGRIRVGLHRVGEGCFELSVADDGVGFPADVDFRNTASLGLQLVSILATQLKGTVQLHSEAGTCFVLSFEVGV